MTARPATSILEIVGAGKPGLTVFFPFDQGTYDRRNQAVPVDLAGNHTVFNNGGRPAPGPLRECMGFGPSVANYLAVVPTAGKPTLEMYQQCSLTAWVNPAGRGAGGSGNATIMARGATNLDNTVSYALALTPGGVPVFEGRTPRHQQRPLPWTVQASRSIGGGWHHVCVVFSVGRVEFFIDGKPAGRGQAPMRTLNTVVFPQSPLYVAARFVFSDNTQVRDPFFGRLDDVCLWARALRSNEIEALAREVDGNRIADYWDFLITGYMPRPMGPTPTPPQLPGYGQRGPEGLSPRELRGRQPGQGPRLPGDGRRAPEGLSPLQPRGPQAPAPPKRVTPRSKRRTPPGVRRPESARPPSRPPGVKGRPTPLPERSKPPRITPKPAPKSRRTPPARKPPPRQSSSKPRTR